jgi:hypothetical protein
MMIGPRNSVVATLLGNPPHPDHWVKDGSEWVVWDPRTAHWHDWPELWVDKLHDFVWEDLDGAETVSTS